jgi:hypothetical protein
VVASRLLAATLSERRSGTRNKLKTTITPKATKNVSCKLFYLIGIVRIALLPLASLGQELSARIAGSSNKQVYLSGREDKGKTVLLDSTLPGMTLSPSHVKPLLIEQVHKLSPALYLMPLVVLKVRLYVGL